MTPTIAIPSPLSKELAAVLAKGYLRLTQTAQNLGISRPKEPHKELALYAKESPPVVEDCQHRRPPWTTA